jgi:trimeric autotransporter adhesin
MKKLLAVLVLVLFAGMSYAQWSPGPGNLYMLTAGNVGIGTTAPTNSVHVYNGTGAATIFLQSGVTTNGTTQAQYTMSANANADFYRNVLRKSATGEYEMLQTLKSSALGGATLAFLYVNLTTSKFEMRSGISDAEFQNTGKVLFSNGGGVGIGTTGIASGVKLQVGGKVKCQEVEVAVTPWPDHVFKAGFNLMPLDEVAAYVQTNKHLPGVPSEEEVAANGVSIGKMNATLLQKVEELTLYMIDLKNQNDALKVRVSNLEK